MLPRLLNCAVLVLLSAVAVQAQDPADTSACLECHGVEGTRPADEGPDGVSIYLGDWERTVHSGLECVDCHSDIEEIPHGEELARVDCSMCHEEAAQLYLVVETPEGGLRSVWDTLRTTTGFAAQHGARRTLGTGDAVAVHALRVHWTDGTVTEVLEGALGASLVIER